MRLRKLKVRAHLGRPLGNRQRATALRRCEQQVLAYAGEREATPFAGSGKPPEEGEFARFDPAHLQVRARG